MSKKRSTGGILRRFFAAEKAAKPPLSGDNHVSDQSHSLADEYRRNPVPLTTKYLSIYENHESQYPIMNFY